MKIQVNTDRTITGDESLEERVCKILEHNLSRFADQITRIEVHLNEDRSTEHREVMETHCMLEIRQAGQQPVAVSDAAPTLDQAVTAAARKMLGLLESDRGRRSRH